MSALERMLEEFEALPAPAARARAAAAALRAGSLPTRRDENWHYADLRALEAVAQFAPRPEAAAVHTTGSRGPGGAPEPQPGQLPPLPPPLPGYDRLVLLDGRLHPSSSPTDSAALRRLRVGGTPEAALAAGTFESGGDGRFGLVALMFSRDPLPLRVSGRQALEILHCESGNGAPSYADVSIELAPGANLELVERQLGAPGFRCSRLRLQLGPGARMQHTRLQQASGPGVLVHTAAVDLAEDAGYRLREIDAGTTSSRGTMQLRLVGRNAEAQILALTAARDAQRCDAQYTLLHEAPATRSDVLFRGIASDRAHVACSADVQVRPGAPGSRVQQSLRGLIDGKGAEVDLRPRLTIDTDDIQASHGATTGRLDEDLLFYLLARGLAPEAARSLLKWAFLGEALRAIEPRALRRDAELAAAARLGDAPATELLQ